jgi:DNA mismatch repair protein MutS
MCGMPHHSIVNLVNRLLSFGFKVALCDQVEDPKLAKGIFRRAVTRVLTPGMVYDVDSLEKSKAHFLAAYDESTLAFLDTSTGEAFYLESQDYLKWLTLFPVVELILSPEQKENSNSSWHSQFVTSTLADGDLQEDPRASILSAKRLISYVTKYNSQQDLKYIKSFEKRTLNSRLILSFTTQKHLELFQNSRGDKTDTLISVMDKTQSSAGSRKLREWMQFPYIDKTSIENRLNQVEKYKSDLNRLKKIRDELGRLGDLERRLAKISQNSCHGKDLQALAQGIEVALQSLNSAGLEFQDKESLQKLADKIERTLQADLALSTKSGGMIQKGIDDDLDELIRLSTESHQILSELETREKELTSISSLKVRYNQVFGYYIEVTHTHQDKVPDRYKRKQTLASAERYYTDELLEIERKILTADVKRAQLESQIFEDLRREVLKHSGPVSWLAQSAAELDALIALSWLAVENNFVRPQFSTHQTLKLVASRHPVVEKSVTPFVANDIHLNRNEVLLLTGPNMAGKSTLMRQVALTAVMAQMGSFVPCKTCEIPIFDQIFTRIGAQDQLSQGLSTFMVEMTETAEILKNLTPQSLVVLDEIGRGTSTYDGMSLAEAILEFLMKKKTSQIFFATHYHEITALEEKHPQLKNAHMSILENGEEIRFLHSLAQGPATRSYGVHVAELAGLPSEVIKAARLKEAQLKGQKNQLTSNSTVQLSLFSSPLHETSGELLKWSQSVKNYNILDKTPLETLMQVQAWQKELKNLDNKE